MRPRPAERLQLTEHFGTCTYFIEMVGRAHARAEQVQGVQPAKLSSRHAATGGQVVNYRRDKPIGRPAYNPSVLLKIYIYG